MTLHLTPAMLEADYELLRATPPFQRWKLPEADGVEFRIGKTPHLRGDFHISQSGVPVITISKGSVGTLWSLTVTMAHEMVHLHIDTTKAEKAVHGRKFKNLARQVCRHHGFDEKLF